MSSLPKTKRGSSRRSASAGLASAASPVRQLVADLTKWTAAMTTLVLANGCGTTEHPVRGDVIIAPRTVPTTATVARVEGIFGAACGVSPVTASLTRGTAGWILHFVGHKSDARCLGATTFVRVGVDVPLAVGHTLIAVVGIADTTWLDIARGNEPDTTSVVTVMNAAHTTVLPGFALQVADRVSATIYSTVVTDSLGLASIAPSCDAIFGVTLQGVNEHLRYEPIYLEQQEACRGGLQIIVTSDR